MPGVTDLHLGFPIDDAGALNVCERTAWGISDMLDVVVEDKSTPSYDSICDSDAGRTTGPEEGKPLQPES